MVWGSSFILMKKGMIAFTSDEVAGLRITIASAFMLPFLFKYHQIDLKKNLKGLLLMGVFGNLIPAFLFTKAETQISSSLTGMLNALTPIFTVMIGVFIYKSSINRHQIIGVTLGFIGAVTKLELFNLPVVNSMITTKAYVTYQFQNVFLVKGENYCNDKKLLECEMKIVIT